MFRFFRKRKITSPEIERMEQNIAEAAEAIHQVVGLWENEKDATNRERIELLMKHQFSIYHMMQGQLESARLQQEINEICAKVLG